MITQKRGSSRTFGYRNQVWPSTDDDGHVHDDRDRGGDGEGTVRDVPEREEPVRGAEHARLLLERHLAGRELHRLVERLLLAHAPLLAVHAEGEGAAAEHRLPALAEAARHEPALQVGGAELDEAADDRLATAAARGSRGSSRPRRPRVPAPRRSCRGSRGGVCRPLRASARRRRGCAGCACTGSGPRRRSRRRPSWTRSRGRSARARATPRGS